MDVTLVIFQVIILIGSVIIHEMAHGYAALFQGDPTAKHAGRLTLNPIKHLDPFGSVILPIVLLLVSAGSFAFGWAKPVPYNPYNLRNQRWGELVVAIAGPISNLILAVIFGILIRMADTFGFSESFIHLSLMIVVINVALAIFNLIPVPPLDGSKILFTFLPYSKNHIREMLERWSLPLLLLVIFFAWDWIAPLVFAVVALIVG